MKVEPNGCLTYVGLGVGVALGIALAVIIRGYVLSVLWEWFIAPTFGLPVLSVPLAIALAMVVAMLAPRAAPQPEKPKKSAGQATWELCAYVFGPLLALPLGALLLRFV